MPSLTRLLRLRPDAPSSPGTAAIAALLLLAAVPADAYPRFVHAQLAQAQGLGGAIASALSPDGRFLYVAGFTDHAVSIFARDPSTGALTFLQAVADTAGPASTARIDGKGGLVDGLSNVVDLAISPDGSYLYSAGWGDDAIGIFRRDVAGGLIFLGSVTDPGLGRLDAISALELSADGSHLFTIAFNAASLCIFDRQAATGALSLSQCVVDPTLLAGARGLALTADGARAYVAAKDSNALAWWDLGSSQGLQAIRDTDPGVSGLSGAYAVALSQDEQDVYVASFDDERLVHLRRSAGGHTFVAEHSLGLGAKTGVWVHPSDAVVYVANVDAGIHRLFRDPADGSLTPAAYFPFSAAGASSAVGLTGSPSGEHLYATALSGAVVVLRLTFDDAQWYPVFVHTAGGPATPHLEGLNEIAVDPSRTRVYAAGAGALVGLRRHPLLGTITPFNWVAVPTAPRASLAVLDGGRVYVANDQSGTIERRSSSLALEDSYGTSLTAISDLAAAPDGRHLYAVSDADEALVVLGTSGPGTLTEVDRLDGSTHSSIFDGTSGVTVSADGTHVYTASYGWSAVTNWERDAGTGLLVLRNSLAIGGGGTSQRSRAAPSPDGRHVYGVGLTGDDLRVYEHQPNGALLWSLSYFASTPGFEGLAGAEDVAVSADGGLVFVAGDDRVAVLDRDPLDGSLSPAPALRDVPPIRGLARPRGLALAPGGSHLYVAAAGGALSIGAPQGSALVFDTSSFFSDGFESGDTSRWSVAVP